MAFQSQWHGRIPIFSFTLLLLTAWKSAFKNWISGGSTTVQLPGDWRPSYQCPISFNQTPSSSPVFCQQPVTVFSDFLFFFGGCACPSCVPFTLHFHFSTFFMIVFIIFALIIFAFSSPVPPLYFHLHYYLYIFMDCLLSTHTFFLPFTSFCSLGFSRCFKY